MPLNANHLGQLTFEPTETVLTDRDAMLYALSIGLGRDPMDEHDLRYTYEKDLRVFPTMPLIVGHPGLWTSDTRTGVTRNMVVHGAQKLIAYADLPIGRPLLTTNKISSVLDKGDKGALVVLSRRTYDKEHGLLLAQSESGVFCRADGGFSGAFGEPMEFTGIPERAPDMVIGTPTESSQALLYRLNHDRNPLHVDPRAAKAAGFARPILHGLCTFGVAAASIARAFPSRKIQSIEARFSKPVTPGECVTVELWHQGGSLAFRARVDARVVLDHGSATLE